MGIKSGILTSLAKQIGPLSHLCGDEHKRTQSYPPAPGASALPALLEVAHLPAGRRESAHGWQPLGQSPGLPLGSEPPVPGLRGPRDRRRSEYPSNALNPFSSSSPPPEAIARHASPHSSLPKFNFCCFFGQTEMFSFQVQFHSSSKR